MLLRGGGVGAARSSRSTTLWGMRYIVRLLPAGLRPVVGAKRSTPGSSLTPACRSPKCRRLKFIKVDQQSATKSRPTRGARRRWRRSNCSCPYHLVRGRGAVEGSDASRRRRGSC